MQTVCIYDISNGGKLLLEPDIYNLVSMLYVKKRHTESNTKKVSLFHFFSTFFPPYY